MLQVNLLVASFCSMRTSQRHLLNVNFLVRFTTSEFGYSFPSTHEEPMTPGIGTTTSTMEKLTVCHGGMIVLVHKQILFRFRFSIYRLQW